MNLAADTVTIALDAAPATDAFGIELRINGIDALRTIVADAPGLFRRTALPQAGLMATGAIVGFLQRGPLLTPLRMPQPGWLLAAAEDGARVGHGTPVLRILLTREGITP